MRSSKTKLLALASAAIVFLIIVLIASNMLVQKQLNPQASTGIFLTGAMYDQNGQQIGAAYGQQIPIGQSIVNVGGSSIGSLKISSAYAKLNYSGQVSSWSFIANEVVQYDKGVSSTYPIIVGGSGTPLKIFNITLPKSAWTAQELQSKWTSYGTKLMNVTVASSSLVMSFTNGAKMSKPSAFNYLVAFTLIYGQPSTTTTSTSSLSTSTTSSTSMTSTTSTTTSISGGSISSGTQDTWTTTINSAANGATGTLAPTGVIVTAAPEVLVGGQTFIWVYWPTTQPTSLQSGITMCSKYSCISKWGATPNQNSWSGGPFSIGLAPGEQVLMTVSVNSQTVFNQVVTISQGVQAVNTNCASVTGQTQSTTCYQADNPPAPYTTPELGYYNSYVATYSPYKQTVPSSQATYLCSDASTGATFPYLYTDSTCPLKALNILSSTSSIISTTQSCIGWRCAALSVVQF